MAPMWGRLHTKRVSTLIGAYSQKADTSQGGGSGRKVTTQAMTTLNKHGGERRLSRQ